MTKRLHSDSRIQAIYNAIIEKTGDENPTPMTTAEMAQAILDISTGVDLMAIMTGDDTFNLDDDTVPTEATTIPAHMFQTNAKIRNVDMEHITIVGAYAFQGSTVNKVELPECLTIGNYAFDTCTSLRNTSIIIPKCTSIGDYAFNNCHCDSSSYTFDFSKVEHIGANAFYEAGFFKSISDLNFPECTSIGNSAFSSYYDTYRVQVTNFDLPKIVTLGNQVFRSTRITNLILGENITTMGNNVFQNATITNLYVYATTPPTVGSFYSNPTHVYVPAESVDTYKAASTWSSIASRIEAIPA